ncbi:hypothetical protein FACS189485_22800 [Spirochaetia bacterium]|nr:hypothetical protein FACS189485_22800 [Spirochaetia bacterium]
MEKRGQYRYTKDANEVHDKVKTLTMKYAGISLDQSNFISALWIENFLSKGGVFLVVTKTAIYDNSNGPFEQININTINSIENVLQFTINTTSGKSFTPFKTVFIDKNIRPLIVGDINEALSKTNAPDNSSATSQADELSKFKVLLDNGTITQEDYDKKKKQILGI